MNPNINLPVTRGELRVIIDALAIHKASKQAELRADNLEDADNASEYVAILHTMIEKYESIMKLAKLFKCDQCGKSFTEDQMTTTGGAEIYCQKCWPEKLAEDE